MSPFTGLIKDGRIGKWCKRGAVLIAIAGTIQILLTLYALWGEYRLIQSNGQTPLDLNYLILSGAVQVFTSIMTTVFFALILYAVGVIILANSAPAHSDVTIEKLDGAEVTPIEEEEVRIVNQATILIIVAVIAIIGLGIGLFARSMSKTRWLKQHGTRIIARVTDSIFAAGSGTAKIIIAEWTDPRTNTTYQFRSYAPLSVHVKLGESVDVLIDPDHPERYTITSVKSISMKQR